jgi:monothiol glutaredoxin
VPGGQPGIETNAPPIDFAPRNTTLVARRFGQNHACHQAPHEEPQMSDQATQDWIKKTVASNDVVLFMKGTKQFPQCGFSGQVAQILGHMGVEYKDVNVLEDAAIRDGIKQFANWPTIPQLYVKGEFVGGCDIVREMFQSGELVEELDNKGVAYDKAKMSA